MIVAHCGALRRSDRSGSIFNGGTALAIRQVGNAGCELRYETVLGFYHKLEGASTLSGLFVDLNGGYIRAENTFVAQTNGFSGPINFYRVITAPGP